jgi:cytochrome c biogenesis protein
MRTARAFWRWLTSMRTALLLLLLLAVAAVPGSLLPQRNVSIENVNGYLIENPQLGRWLDRAWFFDVYASPWFSAIYLLLFASLVGCLVPRLRLHVRNIAARPPDAPARLERLPHRTPARSDDRTPGAAAGAVRAALKTQRWRTVVREHEDGTVTIAGEKGYLKETGNLIFHFALLALLVGVALGSWYGWHGNRLLVADPEHGFCNTVQQYDEYGLGARSHPADLPPFCVRLVDFRAEFLDNGQPVQFTADVAYTEGLSRDERSYRLRVNEPLRLDGANVYLLGHGYAPVLRFTDRDGNTREEPWAFLPDDTMLTSSGVATYPDHTVEAGAPSTEDIGLAGIYLPTVPADPSVGRSAFPAERDPALMLVAYRGDLGLGSGVAQSVYELSQRQIDNGDLTEIGRQMLRPGQSWTLPDGSIVDFVGTRQWVTVSVRHDPGEQIVLFGAGALLAGLMVSLFGHRRRVWARVEPAAGGRSLISLGGLARSEYPGFADEFARLVELTAPAEPAERPLASATEKGT